MPLIDACLRMLMKDRTCHVGFLGLYGTGCLFEELKCREATETAGVKTENMGVMRVCIPNGSKQKMRPRGVKLKVR